MIAGQVTRDRSATVTLEVFDLAGGSMPLQVVIDTGFSGDLTLPPDLISRLGLTFVGRGEAIVGNGAIDLFDIYRGTILWDGQRRRVEIDETRVEPLLGMGLMQGYRLTIDVAEGGVVRLERLA